MDNIQERLKEIKIENWIWVIYIGIVLLSWYANSKEKHFFLYNDEQSRKQYQEILIFIFAVLLIVYSYFTQDSYKDVQELTSADSQKKQTLTYMSFIGSVLILISGILFLIIAIEDENIDTEIAFS